MDQYSVESGVTRTIVQEIPEHEVLLSFNNDDDARFFEEWFAKNRESFESFVDTAGGL